MLRTWPARRWAVAASATALTIVVIGVPTVLVPNPWFGRTVPPTAWALPALVVTAVLSGLVTATYVTSPSGTAAPGGSGAVGGFLTYLAVGCPVCNKIALLALGSAGAVQWFAPVQPFLAVAGIGLLAYALRRRLAGERSCSVRVPAATGVVRRALPTRRVGGRG